MTDIKIDNIRFNQSDKNYEIKLKDENQPIKNEKLEKTLYNLKNINEQEYTNINSIDKERKEEETEKETDDNISFNELKIKIGKSLPSNVNLKEYNKLNKIKEEKNIQEEIKDKNNLEINYNDINEKQFNEINKDVILKTSNQTTKIINKENNMNNINYIDINKKNNENNNYNYGQQMYEKPINSENQVIEKNKFEPISLHINKEERKKEKSKKKDKEPKNQNFCNCCCYYCYCSYISFSFQCFLLYLFCCPCVSIYKLCKNTKCKSSESCMNICCRECFYYCMLKFCHYLFLGLGYLFCGICFALCKK